MHEIQPYSYSQADKLGVSIRPSRKKGKKVDIFKEGKYVCSSGAYGMNDYPTYLKNRGKEYTEERRRLFRLRRKKDNIFGSPGFYSSNILW